MKNRFTTSTLKGVFVLTASLLLQFCSTTDQGKSQLVLTLEKIFYNGDFATIPSTLFDVADFGAVGDGKTLCTQTIQKAIDAASEAGGGKVVFPEGTYLTGAIFVRSNVELHIGEGVILKAVQDNSQFPNKFTRVAGIEMEWPAAIINVYGEENVRITGKGTIDGSGEYWWHKFWGDPIYSGGMWTEYKKRNIRWAIDYDCERVRPVVVFQSKNVLLKGFTVKRAGFWTVSLTYSERVHVDGITIRNNINGHGPSSDGINTDSSSEILIENCDIDCNDDNLGIKSGRDADGLRVDRPSENIVIRNCVTGSGHGLITLGSETSGGMRNIEVYGLEAIGTNTGIRFKSAKVRGGVIENVKFHDIKMKDVVSPFHFELNWYPEYSYPVIPSEIPKEEIPPHWYKLTERVEPAEKGIPEFKNITFENIEATGAKQVFYANAFSEKPMSHFTFKNVSISAKEGGLINYADNWTGEDIHFTVQDGSAIALEGCENIALPNTEYKVEKGVQGDALEKKVRSLFDAGKHVVPVNLSENKIVSGGDTISYSEELQVYIQWKGQDSIQFFEPLGDGFYYSPVKLGMVEGANRIRVQGQKKHLYEFVISEVGANCEVEEADSLSYHKASKTLKVYKEGKDFVLSITNPDNPGILN